jgi:hypothetical protein
MFDNFLAESNLVLKGSEKIQRRCIMEVLQKLNSLYGAQSCVVGAFPLSLAFHDFSDFNEDSHYQWELACN